MELECGGDEGDAVQVAVRMRIFNGREKTAQAERIVRMENLQKGSKTFIMDPDTREERAFSYDYSFQSHSETEQGIGAYATQDTVMSTLGIPVLNAALEGRNVSLFAYGQTGAGKSFSMLGKIGVPELEGIIPRSCREIFRRIGAENNPNIFHTVDVQVVEVYCEQVNDLLSDRKQWPANGHKPRLTAKDGYVVDTTKKPCSTSEQIFTAMEFADKNRSVGSHALNPESSRAHTIYQITAAKVTKNDAGKVLETVTAKLNLIDLAGSERTDSAGTTGQMLKEGNAINLSLTALGGCIKSLSEGKRPNFRDSKLTLLLQGSMTNGKVIMIAAVSPASICYAETVSTLKFADRIKQVKIKSSKNVSADPVAELKKAMEEMRAKMQAEIDALRANATGDGVMSGEDEAAALAELQNAMAEQLDAERHLTAELQKQIEQLEMTDEARAEEADRIEQNWKSVFKGLSEQRSADETNPHFVNLNEDSRLSETLVYPFPPGKHWIGRSNKENPPLLEFNGMGISKDHCEVENTGEGELFITPNGGSRTLVNGKKISGRTKIVHQNRVWLGNNYAFRFVFPGFEAQGENLPEDPDYFVAEAETAASTSLALGSNPNSDLPTALNHKLAESLKKVQQAMMIATDLDRDVQFAPKIYKNRFTEEDDVVVFVKLSSGAELLWPWEKFNTRLVEMVKLWQEWQNCEALGESLPERAPENDPFVDQESQLVGEADVWLQSLANMIDLDADTSILTPFGNIEGKLNVEINPCDKNGNPGPWEEDDDLDPFVDEPSELLDTDIIFQVKINNLKFESQNSKMEGGGCRYENVFVRYKFNMDDYDEKWTVSPEDKSKSLTPTFNFGKKHTVFVTSEILKHITTGRIIFQVWGNVKQSGSSARPTTTRAAQISMKRAELERIDKALEKRKAICDCPHCKKDVTWKEDAE
eukprot:TRINITY_DN61206_c0_g1_i1.p1 TRINITY_DN61206_c0_g1~~TRINITY_DN61206_c0_g1_i1.p1  ORF type:complete len:931 (+),score=93.40 TRINITY_DN61206_c0_g1_i1:106-2898(+)